jgi:hypothetical protein
MTNHAKSKNKPSKKLFEQSYKNTLGDVRSHHRTSKNVFSRLIHANGMDNFHEFLDLTLFNPRLVLSAASFCLIGEIVSVSMAEIFGYSYNNMLFVYFFVFGYLLSLIYLVITSWYRK